ncbi:MAG: hypothetical protein ACLQU2_24085 [Candidatus Binataceae bacterium]
MTPLYSDSPGLFDFESFRGQQSTFALLNLMLIAGLLLIHTTFTDYVGVPRCSPRDSSCRQRR